MGGEQGFAVSRQQELIKERAARGVYNVRPGITGLAQINDIDMSTPKLLAETDAEMIKSLSVVDYFKYIFQTVTGKGQGDRVKAATPPLAAKD